MAATVDTVNSPIRFTGTPARSAAITSASFTATADALLVVCVAMDGLEVAHTVTVGDTGTLAWSERVRRAHTEGGNGGMAGIWTARTTSAVSRTVSITRGADGDNVALRVSAALYAVTGVDVDGTPVDTVGANNEGNSTTNSINTTSITPGATGLLFVSDIDWQALGVYEASSDLTQDTATYSGAISVCSGYKACTSGVGVTGNLNAFGAGAPIHKWGRIIVRESTGPAPLSVGPSQIGEPMLPGSVFGE